MAHSLIVLPDESRKPIVSAIAAASKTIRIKMFVFSDARLLRAVIAARTRGVNVRVLLNPARRNGEHDNDQSRKALAGAGVHVRDANPTFEVTHEKSLVIDDDVALVQSLNWTPANLTDTRDYAVVTKTSHEVAEIIDCFEADWHRQPFEPRDGTHLVWCPGPGRDRICQFIDEARHRLFVQNERFQDSVIIERFVRAAQRGVKVHIMGRPAHTLNKDKLVEGVGGLRIMDDVGIPIHKLKDLRLHGKMMVADGNAALVGSINFAGGSMDRRRELAIEVRDAAVVNRLQGVAEHDWRHSRPIDLTDEGLLADLEKRVEGSAELLAIHKKVTS